MSGELPQVVGLKPYSSCSSSSSSDTVSIKNKSLKRYLAAEYSKELLPIKPKKTVKWGSFKEAPSPSGAKPILRVKGDQAAKKQFEEKQSAEKQMLQELQKGTYLTQYCLYGEQRQRFFYVSEDGSELFCCKVSGVAKAFGMRPYPEKIILLADVEALTFGPRTEPFGEFDWIEGSPYNCFSLLLANDESLDLECPNREQFMLWFLGLQALCPLSFANLSRGMLNWYRVYCITLIKARISGMNLEDYWHIIVAQAREEVDKKHVSSKKISNKAIVPSVLTVPFNNNKAWMWADSAENSQSAEKPQDF